jgi:hypothetical protein
MREWRFVKQCFWCLLCILPMLCSCSPLPRVTHRVSLFGPDLAITDMNFHVIEKYSSDNAKIFLIVTVKNQGNVSIEGSSLSVGVFEKTLAKEGTSGFQLTGTNLERISIPPRGTVTTWVETVFSGHCGGGGWPGLGAC